MSLVDVGASTADVQIVAADELRARLPAEEELILLIGRQRRRDPIDGDREAARQRIARQEDVRHLARLQPAQRRGVAIAVESGDVEPEPFDVARHAAAAGAQLVVRVDTSARLVRHE